MFAAHYLLSEQFPQDAKKSVTDIVGKINMSELWDGFMNKEYNHVFSWLRNVSVWENINAAKEIKNKKLDKNPDMIFDGLLFVDGMASIGYSEMTLVPCHANIVAYSDNNMLTNTMSDVLLRVDGGQTFSIKLIKKSQDILESTQNMITDVCIKSHEL